MGKEVEIEIGKFNYKCKKYQIQNFVIIYLCIILFVIGVSYFFMLIGLNNALKGKVTIEPLSVTLFSIFIILILYSTLIFLINLSPFDYFEVYEKGIKIIWAHFKKKYWFSPFMGFPFIDYIYYHDIIKIVPYFSNNYDVEKINILYFNQEKKSKMYITLKGKLLKEILPHIIKSMGEEKFYEILEGGKVRIKQLFPISDNQ